MISYVNLASNPKEPLVFEEKTSSAVDWRKVLLVLFMIFELGPYLESLWNGLPSEPIRCGAKEFFHLKKITLRCLAQKRRKVLTVPQL